MTAAFTRRWHGRVRPAQLALMAATLLVAVTAARAAEDDDALVSDRPDFVESSRVVGAGRFQVETGFASERNRDAGVKTRFDTTPTLLRLGVADAWELRLETDGFAWLRSADSDLNTTHHEHGFSDLSFGVKWHVQDSDEESLRPSVGWLLHADVDSGSKAFRGNGVRPSLRLAAEWELPNDIGVGVMPGVYQDRRDDGHHFAGGILALTVDKGWSRAFHTYAEVAGQQLAAKRNGGSLVTFDFGGTFLVSESLQFDFGAERGLNHDTPDWKWTAGVTVKF